MSAAGSVVDFLDRVRRPILVGATAALGRRIVDREFRTATLGACLAAAALAIALFAPLWAIAFGPLIFGVPHVLSDVRYLIVRPALHRRRTLIALWIVGAIVVAAFGGLRATLLLAGVSALLARGSLARRLAVAVALAAVALTVIPAGRNGDLLLLHGHHAVAIVFVLILRGRPSVGRIGLALGLTAVAGAIALGAFDPILAAAFDSTPSASISPAALLRTLSWLPPNDPFGPRLLALYAFGQAVHYAIWLRLVPELDRPRETPRSFRQSWRALRRDLGGPVLAIAGVATIGFAAIALLDLGRARMIYLASASWHVHLEILVLAVFAVEGRRTVGAPR